MEAMEGEIQKMGEEAPVAEEFEAKVAQIQEQMQEERARMETLVAET